MAFKLPTLRDLPPQITSDLPSFQYKDIENERPIAKGGFGFVSKANYQNKTVVIKKITSESSEDEKLFLKEAKLIDSLRHANVVGFIAFCALPFDGICFRQNQQVCSKLVLFQMLPTVFPLCCSNAGC